MIAQSQQEWNSMHNYLFRPVGGSSFCLDRTIPKTPKFDSFDSTNARHRAASEKILSIALVSRRRA